MFLATTALTQFWDKQQAVLYLGSWCLTHENQSERESLEYAVLPRIWDDSDRCRKTIEYLDRRYEELVGEFTEYLNSVHGVSHQPRYWRILLGPWIRRFLHTTYDRYCHLEEAFRQHPDLETYVLDPADHRTPEDVGKFSQLVRLDEYNLMVFSQILQAEGREFPAQRLQNDWPNEHVVPALRRGALLRKISRSGKRVLSFMEKRASSLASMPKTVALCNMYLPPADVWGLSFRSRFRAAPLEMNGKWSTPVPGPSMDNPRLGMASMLGNDEFSRIFAKLLPANFPTLYLEGYKTARAETLEQHSRFPRVVTSLTGWYFNEQFKFFAAEASERGSRLVASQHGGMYGFLRTVPEESHESALSDAYMVWGWAENASGPKMNLPSPKLSSTIDIGHKSNGSASKDTVLFVIVEGPRYLVRFISMPLGNQWEEYFDWGVRFLKAGTEKMREDIVVRPLRIDYGWGIRKRFSQEIPDLKWDDGRPFKSRLKTSRIVVIDNPVTTFLEALVANVPTLLFWNPARWETRAEAEPYFERLRQAGILWNTPEEAAAKLKSVYDDPWAWWGSDAVQETRKNFVNRYALTSKDWARHWAKALNEEADLYQAVNV